MGSNTTACELYIPPCIHSPPHPFHPPQYGQLCRINVRGPLSAIEKLLPDVLWPINLRDQRSFQPAAAHLAHLAFRALYSRSPDPAHELIVREERLGWKNPWKNDVIYYGTNHYIDYYDTTFDYLVPPNDKEPEVISLRIFETEYDNASYSQGCYRAVLDSLDYVPHRDRVLAFLECCGKGLEDRSLRERINQEVKDREREKRECTRRYCPSPEEWRLQGFNETPPHLRVLASHSSQVADASSGFVPGDTKPIS